MKIGILTFHHSLNCGAALQAWALQTYLQRQGYNAEIVNYGKIGWPSKYSLRFSSLRSLFGSLFRTCTTAFKTIGIETYRRHLYRTFMQKHMCLGARLKKKEIGLRGYTHLIVGSDQVWHPVINDGDDTYFLANLPDGVKRISYAPSFGVDKFSPELERKMVDWLSRFDALSVREPQGAEIVKRLCGLDAAVVCDPTMLLQQVDYEAIERKPCFGLPEKYIAVYTICGHHWAEKGALELGERMKLPVVHLLGGQLARWYLPSKAKRVTALGPSEWLWFIHNSEYVVTNSFHGTVFSMIFHKPFTVTLNGKSSDARMLSLLNGVGLGDMIDGGQSKERIDCNRVDWGNVDGKIKSMADKGKSYLNESVT